MAAWLATVKQKVASVKGIPAQWRQPLADFQPPPYNEAVVLNMPFKKWFNPTFEGLEYLDPGRPALYVSNHALFGMDAPSLLLELYLLKNIYLRGAADRAFFHPASFLFGRILRQFGAFEGSRDNLHQLMQQGEHILLYPGGGREALKNKDERYQLIWKERYGFLELALQHGYDIIPFATYGADDLLDIRYDANDFRASALGRRLHRIEKIYHLMREGDAFVPYATGFKGIPYLPKPVHLHFRFFPRIETRHLPQQFHDEVKYKLRAQIEQLLNQALAPVQSQAER